MLSEGNAGTRTTRRDVVVESALTAQCPALAHPVGLDALGVADRRGRDGNGMRLIERDEQHAVIIAEHEVACSDAMRATSCSGESVGFLRIEALGPDWQCAEAEHRQSDRTKFSTVTMQAPDQDSGQAGATGFQRDEIPDARFVGASPVVDDENVSRSGLVNCLQKDVDASVVSRRAGSASEPRIMP
jgi:hypothetical protein